MVWRETTEKFVIIRYVDHARGPTLTNEHAKEDSEDIRPGSVVAFQRLSVGLIALKIEIAQITGRTNFKFDDARPATPLDLHAAIGQWGDRMWTSFHSGPRAEEIPNDVDPPARLGDGDRRRRITIVGVPVPLKASEPGDSLQCPGNIRRSRLDGIRKAFGS